MRRRSFTAPIATSLVVDNRIGSSAFFIPTQLAPCNAAFTPSAEEISQARAIIAAFDLPENQGKGVIALDGRMVERLHADIARRTVAIADAIAVDRKSVV